MLVWGFTIFDLCFIVKLFRKKEMWDFIILGIFFVDYLPLAYICFRLLETKKKQTNKQTNILNTSSEWCWWGGGVHVG